MSFAAAGASLAGMARTPTVRVERLIDLPRSLDKVSGVYVIASKQTGQVLYVGESHTNQLRSTLFRHFYKWPQDHFHKHPRAVYDRNRVLVAVYVTPAGQAAIDFQNELICELSPRDALLVCDTGEPF